MTNLAFIRLCGSVMVLSFVITNGILLHDVLTMLGALPTFLGTLPLIWPITHN